jgi:hypothetical protein
MKPSAGASTTGTAERMQKCRAKKKEEKEAAEKAEEEKSTRKKRFKNLSAQISKLSLKGNLRTEEEDARLTELQEERARMHGKLPPSGSRDGLLPPSGSRDGLLSNSTPPPSESRHAPPSNSAAMPASAKSVRFGASGGSLSTPRASKDSLSTPRSKEFKVRRGVLPTPGSAKKQTPRQKELLSALRTQRETTEQRECEAQAREFKDATSTDAIERIMNSATLCQIPSVAMPYRRKHPGAAIFL